MPATIPECQSNDLLATLRPEYLGLLARILSPVQLEKGSVLYEQDERIDAVYFPISAVISMVTTWASGMQAEVGLIGREGLVGLSLTSGVGISFAEVTVQMPGTALRMSTRDFLHLFEADRSFTAMVLRFNDLAHTQVMQTAACNSRHDLEQRLPRWLLMCHDRQDGDTLSLTQEAMATMLGVHRPSITVTARALSRSGVIRYSSGRLTILDRPGLEHCACECYHVLRARNRLVTGLTCSHVVSRPQAPWVANPLWPRSAPSAAA